MTNRSEFPSIPRDPASTPATNAGSNENVDGDQHPIEDRYNTHDTSFRRHYQLNYHNNDHHYEDFYAPAYRFGFALGEDSAAAEWDGVKDEAQRHWQTHHASAWDEVAEAVRYGWYEQRNPEALRVHHAEEFEGYRAGFQRHHLEMMVDADVPFEHYESAYRYGYDLAIDPKASPQLWTEMEPEVRKYYETEYADARLPWENYRDAVQHAWQSMRSPVM